MGKKKNKEKEKKLYMITVTMQFNHEFTEEEVDDGTEIPHESVVAGCVECLANKEYNIEEDEI